MNMFLSSSQKQKVLIVEDSITQAAQIKHVLEKVGFICQSAQDGQKGLDMIPEIRI
jgi:PleD family two-component response regulator